jgi:type IV secretion system protein VirB2
MPRALAVRPTPSRLALFLGCAVLFFAVLAASPRFSLASFGGGMPWEGPLNQLLNSLQGPVARVIGAAAIIGLGVGLAFSEGGSMMRKALWVVLGLAIAFNATSWGLGFLGFSGGVLV